MQSLICSGNSLVSLDLDAELAPIVFPDDPSDRVKKIIQNKKSVLDMPMPNSRSQKTKESPSEMEMDETSQEKPEEMDAVRK